MSLKFVAAMLVVIRVDSRFVCQLFRKDLISAMKLADSEALRRDDYLMISDHWRQEWEKGVQVPVNPVALRLSTVRCVITSPAGAVAKYCNEYVCLCVCLFAGIFPELHARSLPNFAYVRGSVLLRHVDD